MESLSLEPNWPLPFMKAAPDLPVSVAIQRSITLSTKIQIMQKPEPTVPLEVTSPEAYDAYIRQAVQATIDDPSPGVSHEDAKIYFAKKRAELLSRLAG